MTPNTDLICRVLAHIETQPASWEQETWLCTYDDPECGTAACFAGWACLLAGVKLSGSGERVLAPNGSHVSYAATRLLGLSMLATGGRAPERGQLFAPDNDLDDLYNILTPQLGTEPEILRDKVRDYIA